MTTSAPDLIVLHEHPEWQKPLFAALERRGVSFAPFDVTRAAFSNVEPPRASLYFNQASPSAYVRGHTRAVPLALAYMRSLELLGARVLNGADVFALELSKSAQATLLRTLGIDCPRSITFNDVSALRAYAGGVQWPALLKPDQGGSGARIQVVESLSQVEEIFRTSPDVWLPDNLFLLQEYLPHDPDRGIVRLEFLGGELLYASRAVIDKVKPGQCEALTVHGSPKRICVKDTKEPVAHSDQTLQQITDILRAKLPSLAPLAP